MSHETSDLHIGHNKKLKYIRTMNTWDLELIKTNGTRKKSGKTLIMNEKL